MSTKNIWIKYFIRSVVLGNERRVTDFFKTVIFVDYAILEILYAVYFILNASKHRVHKKILKVPLSL